MIRKPVEIIVALERECLTADKAIAAYNWDACEASWSKQRYLAHELDIALRGVPRDTPEFAPVGKRIDRIINYRDNQIKRLRAVSAAISERLVTLDKFRVFSRSLRSEQTSSLLDVTS